MKQWLDILNDVLCDGQLRGDRTGVGTRALFGRSMSFNLRDGFPAVTTKTLHTEQMLAELACFVRGLRTLDEFHKLGCKIWDANGAATTGSKFKPAMPGDLGRIYGVQWRRWLSLQPTVSVRNETCYTPKVTDQLQDLMTALATNPHSRRHLVTAWNPGELDDVCLPPCHYAFQVFVESDIVIGSRLQHLGAVSMAVNMRSVDLFVGLPFDIGSYAVLLSLIAAKLGREAGTLTFFLGDAHLYNNHVDQAATVLARKPLKLPNLVLHKPTDGRDPLFEFLPQDAELVGYESHGSVAAPMNA